MEKSVDVKSKYADWFYLNALEKLYFIKTISLKSSTFHIFETEFKKSITF